MGAEANSALFAAFERGGEMGRLMREMDWKDSPLGPPGAWPEELVTAVSTMLVSGAQTIIFFGPEYCSLYNDAYLAVTGSKHPAPVGRPAQVMWAEELFDRVHERDASYFAADHPFLVERHGFLEETYFDISYDPIRRRDDEVTGIFCIVSETTFRVIGERRMRTLSALASRLPDSRDESALVGEAAAVLAENMADLPFARLIFDSPEMPAAVREATMTGRGGTIPLREITEPPPTAAEQALVLPVMVGANVTGALVVGVSRLLALDRSYRDFLELAVAQISRAAANLRADELERAATNLRAGELERARVAEPAGPESGQLRAEHRIAREFAVRLPAEPTRLSLLRRRLEDFLTGHGVAEADVFDVTVAVSEAAANAIEHPVEPAEPVITVEASIEDDAVLVTVRDTGSWRPAAEGGYRGRGLALIGALTELSVARGPGGTAVTLRRPINPGPRPRLSPP